MEITKTLTYCRFNILWKMCSDVCKHVCKYMNKSLYLSSDRVIHIYLVIHLYRVIQTVSQMHSHVLNPFATGNTTVCDYIFESADNITVNIITFPQDFKVILKRRLRNYFKILKKCFFVILILVGGWLTNDYWIFRL